MGEIGAVAQHEFQVPQNIRKLHLQVQAFGARGTSGRGNYNQIYHCEALYLNWVKNILVKLINQRVRIFLQLADSILFAIWLRTVSVLAIFLCFVDFGDSVKLDKSTAQIHVIKHVNIQIEIHKINS